MAEQADEEVELAQAKQREGVGGKHQARPDQRADRGIESTAT